MSARPRVVADAAIPWLAEALGEWVELVRLPAEAIDRAALTGADALLTRTATRVDAALLEGGSLRLVASGSAGFDHVDRAALEAVGVAFRHAPGCNAPAVGEWVTAALLAAGLPAGATLGVIGCGHTGRAVIERARAVGWRTLRCDPFLPETLPLDELLPQVDAVSLHVPLTADGPHPTRGLLDAAALARLPSGALLVNACRGGVVDEPALRAALASGAIGAALLDVWIGEPEPDPASVRAARLATPHVAGYSADSKARATQAVRAAVCEVFDLPAPPWQPALPPAPPLDLRGLASEELLAGAVAGAHPLAADDAALRAVCDGPRTALAAGFRALRRDYDLRREWPAFRLQLPEQADREPLRGLGFRL